ncbi:MAG: carbohydrate ABC transporter permease [Mycobacteriales bacterium]
MTTQVESAPTAHHPQPPGGRRRRRRRRSNAATFWLFVGPFVVGMVLFSYVPIIWSLVLSFFDAQGTVTPSVFVGVRNYTDLLTDSAFTGSLVTFSLFALFIVPLTFLLSLALALLVNQVTVARAFFRSVFFLPTACSYVVAAAIFKLSLFAGDPTGLANQTLIKVGHDSINYLGTTSPPWYWLPLVSVRLWLQLGFFMILFLAGLQRIPQELYEAAEVDGARRGWQTFRYITFPQLRATSLAVLLLLLINAYQAFDEFYNMLGGCGTYPPYARPPLVYLYYTALGQTQDYGRGSAGALILAAIIMIVTVTQGKIFGFGRAGD